MKEDTYEYEEKFLSPYAFKCKDSKGRERPIEPCPLRTDFQRDRDRIIHSKAFRRLKHKTQVFLSPEGDHYRTRLTHTLEVSQIARTIARSLRLNEDLTEAMAMGHDLGHTPFGHAGERVLNKLTDGVFQHNEQSVRVVKYLENDGEGLNLTAEVIDGIKEHRSNGNPQSLEGKVLCFADQIAYINHDIEDGVRAGIIDENKLPEESVRVLGKTKGERIDTLVRDLVFNSVGKSDVQYTQNVATALAVLKNYMFTELYTESEAKIEEIKAERLIEMLFLYFMKNSEKMPEFYISEMQKFDKSTVVCDYLASMTDHFAISVFDGIYVPRSWKN